MRPLCGRSFLGTCQKVAMLGCISRPSFLQICCSYDPDVTNQEYVHDFSFLKEYLAGTLAVIIIERETEDSTEGKVFSLYGFLMPQPWCVFLGSHSTVEKEPHSVEVETEGQVQCVILLTTNMIC